MVDDAALEELINEVNRLTAASYSTHYTTKLRALNSILADNPQLTYLKKDILSIFKNSVTSNLSDSVNSLVSSCYEIHPPDLNLSEIEKFPSFTQPENDNLFFSGVYQFNTKKEKGVVIRDWATAVLFWQKNLIATLFQFWRSKTVLLLTERNAETQMRISKKIAMKKLFLNDLFLTMFPRKYFSKFFKVWKKEFLLKLKEKRLNKTCNQMILKKYWERIVNCKRYNYLVRSFQFAVSSTMLEIYFSNWKEFVKKRNYRRLALKAYTLRKNNNNLRKIFLLWKKQ
ncbi:hypothetical protein HDU92_002183 [Lobulomyces angularis]|nr:hypothetical protein HDU92_002183 [Lobulomyces angularis]